MNRIATFECSTSQTGYTLSFAYSASVVVNLTVNDLPGDGKQIITQFPVTPEVNGSTVQCFARNITDSKHIEFTSIAYVYAQGKNCYISSVDSKNIILIKFIRSTCCSW